MNPSVVSDNGFRRGVFLCLGAMQNGGVQSDEMIREIQGRTEYSTGLNPVHEVVDQAKYHALRVSMAANGWQGPPIVAWGDWAFTGSHRYWAHLEEEMTGTVDRHIPVIDIEDVFELCGLDWGTHLDDNDGDMWEAARLADDVLPDEVVEYLGLDMH